MARINLTSLTNEIGLHEALTDVRKAKTEDLLRAIFAFIKDHVIAGDDVAIPGFGKFENFERQNGVKTPKFRPSTTFKAAVVA